MKAKEINLEQFQSLTEVNLFLETNYYELEKNRDYTNFLVRYRDYTLDLNDKEKTQFEIDYAIFCVKDQEFFPLLCKVTGKAEKVCAYENLTDGSKWEFDYLVERAKSSTYPLLKAHYYHVLWKCPSKLRRREFALNAIDNYFQGIYCSLKELEKDLKEDLILFVGQQFFCLVSLIFETKGETQKLEELFIHLLEDNAPIPFYEKDYIVTEALNYPKLFRKESFEDALKIYEKEFFEKLKTDDPFLIIHQYIPNALKLSRKLKRELGKWHNLMGSFHLDYAVKETDESRNWIKQDTLRLAINNFKLAKNQEMVAKAEILFRNGRDKIDIPSQRIELTREKNKEIFQYRDSRIALAKKIIACDKEDLIFLRWVSGVDFPSGNYFDEMAENLIPDFLRGTRTIFYDINNNPREGNDEIEKQVTKMNFYKLELDFKTLPFLNTLIVEGIKTKVISAEHFLYFLQNNTWLGQPYYILDNDQKEHQLSWMALVSPSINEFFFQLCKSSENPKYVPDYVLCIDSLATKIEGFLRYFLEQCGCSVSKTVANRVEQMNLNNLMESEGFKKLFNRDDQILFEYLFGGIGGMDIRNNVAHCFFHNVNYTAEQMLLLMSALLRLAKYKFVPKDH